jgi:enoyl-CoA hydratase/carnithine racemase
MAADIRIARKDAGKIRLPEVNLGVLPAQRTQRLSRVWWERPRHRRW